MNQFIEKFATHIKGVLTRFDRLVLRGHLRQIVYAKGLLAYLWDRKVLLKHFGRHAEETSRQIKQASLEVAKQQQRPLSVSAHTYRYQVTEKGRQIINAVLAARHATMNYLLAQAA